MNNTGQRGAQISDKANKVLCWYFIASHWYKFQRQIALKISFLGYIFRDKYSFESQEIIYIRICSG